MLACMSTQAWDRLWTPHRMAYIRGESKPVSEDPSHCPFCLDAGAPDNLVVARGDLCYVVMNLFPYNPGHVLVCPYRHVADYTALTEAEVVELAQLTRRMMTAIRLASNPAGFNIGMNQGVLAGAGISAHLHQHIVPRWRGDSNFMTTVGGARTMVMLLEESRDELSRAFHDGGGDPEPRA
jgi:ATP adenylyltransferase